MTHLQVLGACGVFSSFLSAVGGFINAPLLVGLAGFIMFVGNIYALTDGTKHGND